jgi:glyoxylase-like metal-dependent hydrolase (beta-lactamase superfamily II)
MKLHTINTGMFKLDGGAMFGVVPKSLWNKQNPADENNMCSWAMRCLLIEDGDNLILVDSGMGDKQDEKFFGFYYLHGEDSLIKSIRALGFEPEDITHNLLTHLHFDHCGGSIKWNKDRTGYEPAFPNATYMVGKDQWEWAVNPNPREKASFLKENIMPLQESGQLQFIEQQQELFPGISFRYVYGHTDGMILPVIQYKGRTIVYMADLLPSHSYVPIPWVMAYDTRPLLTMNEKQSFLPEAADNEYILFFEHDPTVECCTVQHTDKGVRVKEMFSLKEI